MWPCVNPRITGTHAPLVWCVLDRPSPEDCGKGPVLLIETEPRGLWEGHCVVVETEPRGLWEGSCVVD